MSAETFSPTAVAETKASIVADVLTAMQARGLSKERAEQFADAVGDRIDILTSAVGTVVRIRDTWGNRMPVDSDAIQIVASAFAREAEREDKERATRPPTFEEIRSRTEEQIRGDASYVI